MVSQYNDGKKGEWQVVDVYWLYQFEQVLPKGFIPFIQQLMNKIFKEMIDSNVEVYIDDIVVKLDLWE